MSDYTPEQIRENRRRWAEALESGGWRQCRKKYADLGGAYCCLGVLNKLLTSSAFGREHASGDYDVFCSAARLARLTDDQVFSFIAANDDYEKSFKQIAAMVRALPDPEGVSRGE